MSSRAQNVTGSSEVVINRWSLDFYVLAALNAFRHGEFRAFTDFTNIINSLVVRPVDGRRDVIIKLRFMQFLSRINNGDRLDITFEDPLTPLESALDVLKSICSDMNVAPRDHERIHNSITEMLIIVCIRAGEFEKADQILQKHFPKGMDSAGKKKLYLNLIKNRRCSHSALQINSYSDFKQDMLDFIDSLYSIPEPFLLKMLLSPDRQRESDESPQVCTSPQQRITAENTCAQSSQQCSASAPGVPAQVGLKNLRLVYSKLCGIYGVSKPFSQLQREVENEALMKNRTQSNAELHLALSETPLERNDMQQKKIRDTDIYPTIQNHKRQDSEEELRDTDIHPALCDDQEQQIDTQQDYNRRKKDTDASGEQSRPVQSSYTRMTVSRLVLEDDSQVSEDESRCESTPINFITLDRLSPRTLSLRRKIASRLASNPVTPATPSVNQTNANKHHTKRRRIASDPESDSEMHHNKKQGQTHQAKEKKTAACHTSNATFPPSDDQTQRETPTRQIRDSSSLPSVNITQREEQCHQCNVESDCEHLIESPAHQTSENQQHKRHIVVVDTESDSHQETDTQIKMGNTSVPPSFNQTPQEKQKEMPANQTCYSTGKKKQDKSSRKSSDTESDVESETPACHSSPLSSFNQTNTEKSCDKRARRWLDVPGTHEDWSDEESLFNVATGLSSHKGKSGRKKWTLEESNWLKEGVQRFGEGRWGKIHSTFPFKDRTSVNLKDRWRTMKKLNLV